MVPVRGFALLDVVFGKTFWSTVIRSALFFPVVSAISLPLVLVFSTPEELAELRSYSAAMWVMYSVWGLLFGSWFGWGFAYWRFEERPVRKGMFAKYPLVTGLYHGVVMWVFIGELAKLDLEVADDRIAATIFGFIVGPPMALMMSAFWRYVPQSTAMRK